MNTIKLSHRIRQYQLQKNLLELFSIDLENYTLIVFRDYSSTFLSQHTSLRRHCSLFGKTEFFS